MSGESAKIQFTGLAGDGARQVRDALVGRLLEELATLGQAMGAGRGDVPPELVEAFDRFAASPALVAALSNPAVRGMLQDPLACEALARHLLEAASPQPEWHGSWCGVERFGGADGGSAVVMIKDHS